MDSAQLSPLFSTEELPNLTVTPGPHGTAMIVFRANEPVPSPTNGGLPVINETRPLSPNRRRTVQLPDEQAPHGNVVTVHRLIAAPPPPIIYDVRDSPMILSSPSNTSWFHNLFDPALNTNARHIRLISREFPWVFDVFGVDGRPVTCSDILFALYFYLQVPLDDVDWQFVNPEKRASLGRALRRATPLRTEYHRVDWLGSRTIFLGLKKDRRFAATILRHGIEDVHETWTVKFGPPSEA